MFGFGQLIEILKKDPKKIVFTEILRRLVQALRRAVSISVEQRL